MAKRDIIGIGGSAGSTQALKALLGELPAGLDATIFITTHIAASGNHYLAEVLSHNCALPVRIAVDGEEVLPGRVYLAHPDAHLLALGGRVRFGMGPRENMVRPAVDPMLRSLAMTYGSRCIGVILSGALNDGASGLVAVKQCGGLAVVQSPDDAAVPEMPNAAIEAVEPDHLAPAQAIGVVLTALVETDAPPGSACAADLQIEVEIAAGGPLGSDRLRQLADPAVFTCPNCQGVLSEMRGTRPLRYRCQTGHAVTGEILDQVRKEETEQALRIAFRVMQERADLVERMGRDARRMGRTAVAELYEARHKEYAAHADTLRKAVVAGLAPMVEDDPMRTGLPD